MWSVDVYVVGAVLHKLHVVLVDLFKLCGFACLPSVVSGFGALVTVVRIVFVGEAGFPDVGNDIVYVAKVTVNGSSGHPKGRGGSQGLEGSAEGDGAENIFVAGGASVDVDAFYFPVVLVGGANDVDGCLEIILVGKSSTSGANN